MSLRPDYSYRCDRCDADVGNGGVHLAVVVSDMDEAGAARVLHFCRKPRKGAPHGCAAHLLSPANLAAYRKAHP